MKHPSEIIKSFVGGNHDAYDFILKLWGFVDVWDDAVDRDKAMSDDEINASILWAFLDMADNAFYQRHQAALKPALYKMVASWVISNKFARSGKRELVEQAYFMRCSPYDVFSLVVFLASGYKKMVESEEYFRSVAPDDTLSKYLDKHLGG